jgi:hypothetical protein
MGRKIKMHNSHEIELDGDLMAIIEALYEEVVIKKDFKHTYLDMKEAIETIIGQMNEEELRAYLLESTFMNTVSYENQMLEALLNSLEQEKNQSEE